MFFEVSAKGLNCLWSPKLFLRYWKKIKNYERKKIKKKGVKPRLILGDATEPNLARNYEKFKFKNTLGYF